MKSLILYLVNNFRSNGYIFGSFILLSRFNQTLRSKLFSIVLKASFIRLGPRCNISGIRFIQFGKGIKVNGSLWLQAVTHYNGSIYNPHITIGDRVAFSNNVHITAIKSIAIGNDVLFGSNVYISDHNHGGYSGEFQSLPETPPAKRELIFRGDVIIQDNVWFGDNVNVVGPVHIGYGAVIAANSVIRSDIPAHTIVAGAPAKII